MRVVDFIMKVTSLLFVVLLLSPFSFAEKESGTDNSSELIDIDATLIKKGWEWLIERNERVREQICSNNKLCRERQANTETKERMEFEISSKAIGPADFFALTEAGFVCESEECKKKQAAFEMRSLMKCTELINSEVCQKIPVEERRVCGEKINASEFIATCIVDVVWDIGSFLVATWNVVVLNPIDSVKSFNKFVGSGLNHLGVETHKIVEDRSVPYVQAFGLVLKDIYSRSVERARDYLSTYVEEFDCYNQTKKAAEVCRVAGDILAPASLIKILTPDMSKKGRQARRERREEKKLERARNERKREAEEAKKERDRKDEERKIKAREAREKAKKARKDAGQKTKEQAEEARTKVE